MFTSKVRKEKRKERRERGKNRKGKREKERGGRHVGRNVEIEEGGMRWDPMPPNQWDDDDDDEKAPTKDNKTEGEKKSDEWWVILIRNYMEYSRSLTPSFLLSHTTPPTSPHFLNGPIWFVAPNVAVLAFRSSFFFMPEISILES